jgi:hypothetical protein
LVEAWPDLPRPFDFTQLFEWRQWNDERNDNDGKPPQRIANAG